MENSVIRNILPFIKLLVACGRLDDSVTIARIACTSLSLLPRKHHFRWISDIGVDLRRRSC